MYTKISELCIRKGTTVTALERNLNFGKGTISKWKESSPSVDKLKAVADYFGVSIEYFLGDKKAG